jgi:hypothetical protein
VQLNFNRSSPIRYALFPLLYTFNLKFFDTLLMYVFDKRFRPPALGCFLWAFFLWILMAWFMWLHFDLGKLLITLSCFSNLFVEFFVRAHMTLAEMAWCSTLFVGYHLEVYSDYLCLMAWDICLWLLIPKDGSYLDHQYDLKRETPCVVLLLVPYPLYV